jgi:Cu/Ag efflux protein CusF
MTLVYEIPKNLISKVKPGDKVKFTATQANNRYAIDEIEVDK